MHPLDDQCRPIIGGWLDETLTRQWTFKVIAPDDSVHNVRFGNPQAAATFVARSAGEPLVGKYIVIREDDKVFRYEYREVKRYQMDPSA